MCELEKKVKELRLRMECLSWLEEDTNTDNSMKIINQLKEAGVDESKMRKVLGPFGLGLKQLKKLDQSNPS